MHARIAGELEAQEETEEDCDYDGEDGPTTDICPLGHPDCDICS
jgi:hypothetical protein